MFGIFGTRLKEFARFSSYNMLRKIKRLFRLLGAGIITGASDDDPAGIAIYTQTGAQSSYSLLWIAPFITPLMVSVQEMCARIGLVTGHGLIGTMRRHYPPLLLWVITVSVLLVNTVNAGADLSAMAASTRLLVALDEQILAGIYIAIIFLTLFFFSYKTLVKILKWLTFSLFAYILATLFSNPDWGELFKNTLLPHITLNRETLLLIVAILGTTISPYLFFWQASEEAEDRTSLGLVDHRKNIQSISDEQIKFMREDVGTGMIFSNLVMYFIIAAAGSTLFQAGINNIETAEQAASALRPLAGDAAFLLFTLGIVGTGLLAIPVLSGSAAYAISEVLGLNEGFTKPIHRSKIFYGVIALSLFVSFLFPVFGIPTFKALFITGVLYGLLSPILILIILDIANRKEVMGLRVNSLISNVLGVLTFVILSLAAVGALVL